MSDIYVGELQDEDGNTVYPHTEADVCFCTDGKNVQEKINNELLSNAKVLKTVEEIEANTNPENIAGATALKEVNNKLANGRVELVVTEDGLGYKLDGADTVHPFSNIKSTNSVQIYNKEQANGISTLNDTIVLRDKYKIIIAVSIGSGGNVGKGDAAASATISTTAENNQSILSNAKVGDGWSHSHACSIMLIESNVIGDTISVSCSAYSRVLIMGWK